MAMAKDSAYLAFDLGASSGRAVLGRPAGEQIELEEIYRFPNAPAVEGDELFWDFEGLFGHLLEAMRQAGQRGINVRAVAVDTWGVDFGLLDERGQLLERPHCYRDSRTAGVCRRIAQRIGAQRLQARTGSMHQDHDTLCQLLAAKERTPEVLKRARRLLFMPDLLRYRLCGDQRSDCTIASTSLMYDAMRREWAADILKELDLPGEILPTVVTGPALAGTLTQDVQKKTGLGAVPVVAGAGHDTGAAYGLCRRSDLPPPEDLVVISSGTWSVVGVFVDRHLLSGTVDPALFGYEANPDGSLRLVRNLTGGWLIEQCRKAWAEGGVDISYETLIASARQAEGAPNASAILDVQWDGFTHPESMPAAILEHCRQTGQPAPKAPGEFTHVIFASLAENYARTINQLRSLTGRRLGNIYIIGGMSRNAYLNELTSRRAGAKVLVGPAEATAMGNIAVQMAAVGYVKPTE